jgi:hypothetical protein
MSNCLDRSSEAKILIQKAREQAVELDYDFNTALADVLGCLLFEVDAELYGINPKSKECFSQEFKERFFYQINSFYKQAPYRKTE